MPGAPLDRTEVIARRPTPPGPPGPVRPPRRASRRPLAVLLGVIAVLIVIAAVSAAGRTPAATGSTRTAAPAVASGGPDRLAPAVEAGRLTPNVIGRPVAEAGATLIAAGYRSPISWRADPVAGGTPCTVVRQDPPAGTTVAAGAQATLVIVRGRCR